MTDECYNDLKTEKGYNIYKNTSENCWIEIFLFIKIQQFHIN